MRLHLRLPALGAVVALLVACSPAGSSPAPEIGDEITIATEFPLSDSALASGPLMDQAVRLAVAQSPRAGRYRLEVRSFDDALAGFADSAKAGQNVRRMVEEPDVLAMVGPRTSVLATSLIPIAAPARLAMVLPSVTYNCLTLTIPGCPSPERFRQWGPQNYVRLAAPDNYTGKAMADLAWKTLGVRKAAILLDDDPGLYGVGLGLGFMREFPALGGEVVFADRYSAASNDLTPLLNRIAASGAQALFVAPGVPATACRMRAEMRVILPSTTYFLSTDSVTSADCLRDAEVTDDERMIATIGVPPVNRSEPRAAAFLRSPAAGVAYGATAYDSALVAVDAIRRAVAADRGRIPTRAQVAAAVRSTPEVKGISGVWSFDANGDATLPGVSFYRPQQGEWKLWTPPEG